jgi:phosphate transport system ATP-binding protein
MDSLTPQATEETADGIEVAALPPPVRRIEVDKPLTVAPPPADGNAAGIAVPSRRRATEGFRAQAVERMQVDSLSVAYGSKLAVKEVSLRVRQGEILALIGPSGCGKTTLLRSLNRLVDLTETAARGGTIVLDGEDVDEMDVTVLRRRVGMLFQQPNPFPMSIFDNVAYGLREGGAKRPSRRELQAPVIDALQRAGLYEEVKDNLNHPALALSGGQQQRLCIARALAIRPEVLLLDEPCSALDPISTEVIEDQLVRLRSEVAIVIVTHNLQQAERIADYAAFMYLGDLVEYGPASQLFTAPTAQRTRDYIAGGFG